MTRDAMRHRLRRAAAELRRHGADLRPLTATVLAELRERPAPPPAAFARFGAGSWIVPPAVVEGADRIEIGADVVMLELGSLHAAPGARLRIGDGARLARDVHVTCTVEVTIGREVSTSDYVAITDTWGPTGDAGGSRLPAPPAAPVVIERGAYLGCGSTVGPGVTVGAGAFVGEGAVVVEDVPPHTVVYGNPARVVRRLERDGWVGSRFG